MYELTDSQDAIEYHAKEIKFLKEKIENKRADIEQLIKRDRHARKQHKKNIKPHGENYGTRWSENPLMC